MDQVHGVVHGGPWTGSMGWSMDHGPCFVYVQKTDLLAKIDVRGKAYEKVRYDASPQQPIRNCSTSSYVNSITISVRDQDGELFDFKDMPLEFELELN